MTIDSVIPVKTDARIPRTTGGWIFVLLVILLLTEQTILATVLFASALPQLGKEFDTPHVVWVLSMTTLVGAILTPLAGRLADLYGKKLILVALSVMATIGSVVSATATSWEIVLLGRAISGASMAFLPLGYALIQDIFPLRLKSAAISVATNGVGIITVIGPLVAGLMIDNLGVMSIFWPMVALSLSGTVLLMLFVPETTIRASGRIDWIGAALLGGGLGAILYALDMGPSWGWLSSSTVTYILSGLSAMLAWFFWERTTSTPLVDVRILTNPVILKIILTGAATMIVIPGISSIYALMLMTPSNLGVGYGLGTTATQVAFHTMLGGALLVLSGLYVGVMAHKIHPGTNVAVGGLCLVCACILFANLHSESWQYIAAYGLMGLGGMILAACPILIVISVPEESRAVSAAMLGATTAVAGTLGTQLTFGIAATRMVSFTGGFPVYQSSAFTLAFSILAVVAVVPFVIGLSLRKTSLMPVELATQP